MEEETLLRERLQAITVSIRLFFLFFCNRESRFFILAREILSLYTLLFGFGVRLVIIKPFWVFEMCIYNR